MSFTVYRVDKRTGAKYAYRQENVWDSERGQSRAKRTYLGRVDPETGEIIPKRGSLGAADGGNGTSGNANVANGTNGASAGGLEEENARLRARVAALESALARLSVDALAAIGGEGA